MINLIAENQEEPHGALIFGFRAILGGSRAMLGGSRVVIMGL